MCGNSDDLPLTDDVPGRLSRNIVLPNMHSVKTREQAKVCAVVEDEGTLSLGHRVAQYFCVLDNFAIAAALVAILQQRHSRIQ